MQYDGLSRICVVCAMRKIARGKPSLFLVSSLYFFDKAYFKVCRVACVAIYRASPVLEASKTRVTSRDK